MICKARETELGRPSRKRLPSEARLVLRPAFAGWRPAPGPSRYFTSRALTPLPQWEHATNGMTVAAATHVNQRQGSRLAVGKPAVAELHQGDEARIEIEPHLGQSIFLALRGAGRGLTENGELRQLLQAICKCRPRDAERRTESLERLRPEERLANDQERPRVRNDVERPGDRAVPFAPRHAGLGHDRPRSRSGRWLRCLNLGGGGHLMSLCAARNAQAVSKGALV